MSSVQDAILEPLKAKMKDLTVLGAKVWEKIKDAMKNPSQTIKDIIHMTGKYAGIFLDKVVSLAKALVTGKIMDKMKGMKYKMKGIFKDT